MERIQSFSIPPGDKKAQAEVAKLKEHSKKTGTKFSYLVITAIAAQNKVLKL